MPPEAPHQDVETTSIEVSPLSIHIGAEIGGVDLSKPLPPAQVRDIRAAWLKWKVVFFRDQPMTHRQHIDFSAQFGEVTPGHVVYGSDSEYPEIYSIAKNRTANHFRDQVLLRAWTGWHTDITAAINPPMASILRGDIVPPYGGDTQFTSMMAAYNAMSPTLRAFVDGLRGIHRNGQPQNVETNKDYSEKIKNRFMESEHPMVRVHPETGERGAVHRAEPSEGDRRPDPTRKPGSIGTVVGTSGAPGIHRAVQVGAGQRRLLGQSVGLPPGAARYLRFGFPTRILPHHAGRRRARRDRRQKSKSLAGEPITAA